MRFEGAIFDLDGTLIDSMWVWEKVDIDFLGRRGLAVPGDYGEKIKAMSFEQAAMYTIAEFGMKNTPREIMAEWNDMAAHEYAEHVFLRPGAREYLDELKAKGVKLAVATALTRGLMEPCLRHNGVLDIFDAVCSTDEAGRGKESPDVFLLAAEKMGVMPEKCIVFEDVLTAVKSAKRAGMTVCGVYDSYSSGDRAAIEACADMYIESFRDAPRP